MRIRKVVKRSLVVIAAALVITVAAFWELVSYASRQGYGQLSIIWKARPVDEFLMDPDFPDSLKERLQLIDTVRQYAIDSLGLRDTENYKTLYDQQGKEIMWVVMACKPFELIPKEWKFPIVGAMPYKGFFNEERAIELQEELQRDGWDVIVRNPGGWSTLGWLTDPILSKMLNRSQGDLANLIIHEMSHATIFVKDSVDFNENLATFIGDRGAEKFLLDTYGEDSREFIRYQEEDEDYVRYVDHMLRGAKCLDSLYATLTDADSHEKKIRLKEMTIQRIVNSLDTLTLALTKEPSKRFRKGLPNNAYFMNFRQYQSKQGIFMEEWTGQFNKDLKAYIRYLSEKYPYL
jgi:predicted aminopeptidase